MGQLQGRTEPRLSTPPARRLTATATLGHDAIRFAETMLGIELLPWQKWWLLHALELKADVGFRFRTIITLVARQNGKSLLLQVLALFLLYSRPRQLVLGAAQSLDIARESWSGAVDLAQADDELRAEIDTIRRANGEQELRLSNGSRYRITAATRSAGRGLSVDLLVLDELREARNWDAWSALSAQLADATRAATGDGWRFARRGAGGVDALYATAAAVTAARALPARPRPLVLVGRAG